MSCTTCGWCKSLSGVVLKFCLGEINDAVVIMSLTLKPFVLPTSAFDLKIKLE